MDAPSSAEIRQRSPLLADAYPAGEPGDSELQRRINVAAPLVGSMTGRAIAGTEGEEVPDGLLELAREAIALKTNQLHSALGTLENAEDALDRSGLRSIAAGSWSESYWGPGEAAQAKQLDNDPILASLLWALCTEDKKHEWEELWSGKEKGYSVIESFNYSARPGRY